MNDLFKFNEQFNKYKNIIIDSLINYYGQEYSDIIKNRLENVIFDFSSIPEEDYYYINTHKEKINILNKILMEKKVINFKKTQYASQKHYLKILIQYIKDNLLMDNQNIDDKIENSLSLFTNESLTYGYIDAYGSKNIDILENPETHDYIKNGIIYYQQQFMKEIESLNIKLKDLTIGDVDKFIDKKQELQKLYKARIIEESTFGKNFSKKFEKELDFKIDPENLGEIAFKNIPLAGIITHTIFNSITYHHFIKIPLLYLINIEYKGLDVSLVHEMIHKAEAFENRVGISTFSNNNTNEIINEIRTHNLAIKITKDLHDLGIYIYDNPNDCKIEGESTYELLFPLAKDFIDEYETFFSNCAINNTPDNLPKYFGPCWDEFSKQLDKIYYNYIYYVSIIPNMPKDITSENITNLIYEMKSYQQKNKEKCLTLQ